MRIITDSAADFTSSELQDNDIHCVYTQIIFGDTTYEGHELNDEEFWTHILAGETFRTSQPSPTAFLTEFEEAKRKNEDAICVCISSALSGTLQSARIAASMIDYDRIHIIDSLSGAAGQKLLVLAACALRDEGKALARDMVDKLEALRSRIRLFASLDTLDNLARSGRIPKAVASLGTLAQLKPIVEVSQDGRIVLCGKAFGRHRAIETLAKRVASIAIDKAYPIVPLYSHSSENCCALIRKLVSLGVSIDQKLLSSIGPSIAGHIGPNAYGVAFVEEA